MFMARAEHNLRLSVTENGSVSPTASPFLLNSNSTLPKDVTVENMLIQMNQLQLENDELKKTLRVANKSMKVAYDTCKQEREKSREEQEKREKLEEELVRTKAQLEQQATGNTQQNGSAYRNVEEMVPRSENCECDRLKTHNRDLATKNLYLVDKVNETNRENAELKEKLDRYISEINQLESRRQTQSLDDTNNLKLQVTQLIEQLQTCYDNINALQQQRHQLQHICDDQGKKLKEAEARDDADRMLMGQLQETITSLEQNLDKEKQDNAKKRQTIEVFREKLDQLMTDYDKLLKVKAQLQRDADSSMARLLNLEEALRGKEEIIQTLKNNEATLETQMLTYKQDFDDERKLREQQNDKIVELKGVVKELENKLRLAEDQLNQGQRETMNRMLRRHVPQHHNIHHEYVNPVQHEPPLRQTASERELRQFVCPLCNKKLQDMDSLELHCSSCNG